MKGLRNAMVVGLLTAAAAGCGDAPDSAADEPLDESAPAWVDSVAAVADAIETRPSAVDSVLAAYDMTRARLDSLLYVIAADPVLTEAYQAARGQ